MLETGEIDSLIAAHIPKCVLEKPPKVGRLFEDHQAVEQNYYQRTGIFPIMHVVVVEREFALQQPELRSVVYEGFCDAKDSPGSSRVSSVPRRVPTRRIVKSDRAGAADGHEPVKEGLWR